MEVGVSAIPVSEVRVFPGSCITPYLIIARQFYCEQHCSIGENYARFAFCKDVDTLKNAAERLQKLKQFLR